jgi:hypothetical protein
MMSLSTIEALSREAAERAAEENQVPFTVEQEDLDAMPPFPFPNIGSYVPDGWEQIDEFFVDKTGMDFSGPALSVEAFKRELKVGRAYAIVGEGQFQVYVGEFVRS